MDMRIKIGVNEREKLKKPEESEVGERWRH